MTVYAVTGKLGSGKTLYAMDRIRAYIWRGRPVATNIEIAPYVFCRPWRDESEFKVFRVPDRPSVEDLEAIGRGNDTRDETRNGLLVLDECATWLNARAFQSGGRSELIDWFVHARKLGWDVIFVLQNVQMLDKQLRDGVVEMHTICRRFDRYNLPVLTWIGIRIKLPRVHFAITKYGCDRSAVVADRHFFTGSDLFRAYDTQQMISAGESRVFQLLPPWQLKGRYMKKVQLWGFTVARAWAFGAVLGLLAGGYAMHVYHQDRARRAAFEAQTVGDPRPVPVVELADVVGDIVSDGRRMVALTDGRMVEVKSAYVYGGGTRYVLADGTVHKRVAP